jgi:hypothetical protein
MRLQERDLGGIVVAKEVTLLISLEDRDAEEILVQNLGFLK